MLATQSGACLDRSSFYLATNALPSPITLEHIVDGQSQGLRHIALCTPEAERQDVLVDALNRFLCMLSALDLRTSQPGKVPQ